MFKMFSALSLAVTLAAGVVLVGCSKAPAPADESAPPAGDAAVQEASPSDLPEGFAELSDADPAAAPPPRGGGRPPPPATRPSKRRLPPICRKASPSCPTPTAPPPSRKRSAPS